MPSKTGKRPDRRSDLGKAQTANGWLDAIGHWREVCERLQRSELDWRYRLRGGFHKLLWEAGCEQYARLLYDPAAEPPENPSPQLEAAAIKAFLTEFERPYVNPPPSAHPLGPDQAKELGESRERAIRAMEDRLRKLIPDADSPKKKARQTNKAKGKRIDERMLAAIRDNKEALYWSSNAWKTHLDCAASTVKESRTWKTVCLPAREEERNRRGHRLRGRRKREPQQSEG